MVELISVRKIINYRTLNVEKGTQVFVNVLLIDVLILLNMHIYNKNNTTTAQKIQLIRIDILYNLDDFFFLL